MPVLAKGPSFILNLVEVALRVGHVIASSGEESENSVYSRRPRGHWGMMDKFILHLDDLNFQDNSLAITLTTHFETTRTRKKIYVDV